jgi:hypothetical protein
MPQPSPAKIKVSEVQQICIVCDDLQKTMEAYWNILGIGPWAIFEFGSHKVPAFKYHGKPAYARYRGAIAQVGPLEFELFETIEGDSVYQDWIDEHGEGLHHLKFVPDDVAKAEQLLVEQGFPVILSGGSGDYRFSYLDIEPLRCIWEMSSRSRTDGPPKGATFFPEDPKAQSPAKVKVSALKQVGICVKDAIRSAENYWNILGIGPWEIREWGTHALFDRTYYGRPGWGFERIAHAYLGDLELEFVQPVEGYSIYQDWIDEHGEGLHHLKFLCEDIDEVVQALTEQGFPSIQGGHFGDPKEKAGGFNYIDIPPLHCIWEPVHKPKSLPIAPIARVPAD